MEEIRLWRHGVDVLVLSDEIRKLGSTGPRVYSRQSREARHHICLPLSQKKDVSHLSFLGSSHD